MEGICLDDLMDQHPEEIEKFIGFLSGEKDIRLTPSETTYMRLVHLLIGCLVKKTKFQYLLSAKILPETMLLNRSRLDPGARSGITFQP